MTSVLLIHWKAAEIPERAALLRRAGFGTRLLDSGDAASLRSLGEDPPAAVVIDLGRTPSHGRDVALFLRQRKATRTIPLVFVGGENEKVRKIRGLLPDATFTDWKRIGPALRRACKSPPRNPVRPSVMAGYSGTPLPRKLGIRPGARVALLGAPRGFEAGMGKLPEGVVIRRRGISPAGAAARRTAPETAGIILLFAQTEADLARRLPAAIRALGDGGRLWIVWPKRASGRPSDLNQARVRAIGLGAGLVDYKICSVDEVWSALCFARRKAG